MDRLTVGACKIDLPAADCPVDWAGGVAPPDPPVLHPNEIERLLAEQGGWRDAAAPFMVTGPLGSIGFSRVFRGDGGMFPCPVAIKQFLRDPSGASPAESARTYFHGLQKMAEITARVDLRATEPYALLESHGVVVASWIEGPTLARSLSRGPAAHARELIRDAGIWLARLHHTSGVERRSPDVADMLARLEAELAEKAGRTGSLTRRAVSVLGTAVPLLATQKVPWSCHYGDFKPANLIVREGRLVGIDLELLCAAPTVRDAAHFLNHLQLRFYSPRAMPRWRQLPRLTELFCQGYSDAAGEPLPHRLLLWQRLFNATYLMTQHREWSLSPMALPVRLALGHLVRALCNTLAD
jgi:hypothetical protein